jgi:ADP-heptose:LPS heptosyltransferase
MLRSKNKIAVFVSSGIGNVVLLVPLLRLLKKSPVNHVSIILTSSFVDKDFLIFNNFPFDEIIDLKKTKIWKLSNWNFFNKAYLDFSSSSMKNLILASYISKKTFAYRKNKIPISGINFVKPEINIHAAVLHARMIDESIDENNFSLDLMHLIPQNNPPEIIKKLKDSGLKIIVTQISSGNNKTKYKNWPIEYWIVFLKKVLTEYSGYYIVLLGDKNEIKLGSKVIREVNNQNIISFIGKTSLTEASAILYNSDFYIGLDSAFMHLAVAYDIPTFTIWGGSSFELFGYNKFDKQKHKIIFNDINCRPCNAWIGANTTRVKNPNKCPDFKCLYDLKPEIVFKKFKSLLA